MSQGTALRRTTEGPSESGTTGSDGGASTRINGLRCISWLYTANSAMANTIPTTPSSSRPFINGPYKIHTISNALHTRRSAKRAVWKWRPVSNLAQYNAAHSAQCEGSL